MLLLISMLMLYYYALLLYFHRSLLCMTILEAHLDLLLFMSHPLVL